MKNFPGGALYREKKYGIMNAIRPADDPGGDGREVYSMARIVEVTDLTAPGPDVFAGLTEGQLRSRRDAELGLFIAESPKVIVRALDAGYEPISLLMEPRQIEGQGRGILERCPDVPVYTAQREVLANLTGYPLTRACCAPCGAGRCPRWRPCAGPPGASRCWKESWTPPIWGRFSGSAAALGIGCGPGHADLYGPAVPAGGAGEHGDGIPGALDPNRHQAGGLAGAGLARLRAMGFVSAAMALREESLSMEDPRLREVEKLAIVLGTEGDGLSDGTIAQCDYTVRIPMARGVDSLNVAAASAVAFWELRAQ